MKCFECGCKATENHHIIPKSSGGTKTVPLCGSCHAKVHQMNGTRRDDHSTLTKLGLKKAIAQRGEWRKGVITDQARINAIKQLKINAKKRNIPIIAVIKSLPPDYSLRQIAKYLNENGYKTSRGKEFKPTTVNRLKK